MRGRSAGDPVAARRIPGGLPRAASMELRAVARRARGVLPRAAPGWRATGPGSAPPSLGPIVPSAVFLTHVSDRLSATIAIGMPNPIDSGTLVAVTIVPRRP